MRGALPARHLLRRYALFALTVVFFLSLARAALTLWQFDRLESGDTIIAVFVTGLRFDLALCGIVLLPSVAVGTLLALFDASATLARYLIGLSLIAGVAMVVGAELVTPVFINESGLRPDLPAMLALQQPVELVQRYAQIYPLPLAIGGILLVLVLIAFIVRLEPGRLLRTRLSRLSGLLLWSGATLVCLFAIVSGPDPTGHWLSPRDAVVSEDATVNELPLNSLYKMLYSLARTP